MAQLSPELTGRLVDRWQELETKLAAPAVQAPQTYLEALKALVVSEESKLALEAQTRALLQQIETEQPYVELAHALTGATTMTRRDWLAMMKDEHETDLKEKALTQWLEDQGYCYRDQASRQLRAYAHYSNLFKLEYELINGGYRPLLKVTGQGVLELTPKVVAHFAGESK
jgi:phage antirepressor YoqD-like protein